MGCAGTGSIKNDGIVEHVSKVILVALKTIEKVHELLGKELVILGEV